MHTTQKSKEFVISLEDKPGRLAELTRTVANANVSILGIDVVPNGPTGTARFVVNEPAKMEQALRTKGIQFQTVDVLSVRVPNAPGSLAEVTERLAKAGVDIQTIFGYAGHAPTGTESEIVLQCRDIAQAEKALGA